MDREIAEKIIRLAEESRAAGWFHRKPTKEMLNYFGSAKEFIEMPKAGDEPCGTEVLAEDYGVLEEMRPKHIEFILLLAHHGAELARHWLQPEALRAELEAELEALDRWLRWGSLDVSDAIKGQMLVREDEIEKTLAGKKKGDQSANRVSKRASRRASR